MRPLRFSGLVLSVGLALSGTACGSPASTPDAGGDAHVLAPSTLFGPCEADSQCPGEGAICRRDDDGYPMGYCTVPCEDRTPCDAFGAYHHCATREGETQSYCEQRCLNGFDCGREAYTCVGELPPSGGVCLGVCSTNEQCSAGYECDRLSGVCYAPGTAPTTGGVVGDPCDSDAACHTGRCIETVNATGNPTGWVDGMCVSNCILPTGYNSSTFYTGATTLPSGTCAGDAVCFPQSSYSEGDLGICFDRCTTPDDCRPGYECQAGFATASGRIAMFDDGVCLPADCSMQPCPSGYACTRVTYSDGSTGNICAPN